MSVFSPEQLEAYERDGYLLASGLIPDAISAAAESAMYELTGISPDNPATWVNVPKNHTTFDSPELVACYTPAFLEAAELFAGEPGVGFRPPSHGYAINIFPSEGEWSWPRPHIDHAIKEHGHEVFPRAFKVATMTFLSDVPEHGGGTVVWPGGHRQLLALAEDNPEAYKMMYDLNRAWDKVDLADPVETTPRRGDVLFYGYLTPHAGSKNASNRPRLAMNRKW